MSEYKTFVNVQKAAAYYTQCVMENRNPTMTFDVEFGQWEITADPKK